MYVFSAFGLDIEALFHVRPRYLTAHIYLHITVAGDSAKIFFIHFLDTRRPYYISQFVIGVLGYGIFGTYLAQKSQYIGSRRIFVFTHGSFLDGKTWKFVQTLLNTRIIIGRNLRHYCKRLMPGMLAVPYGPHELSELFVHIFPGHSKERTQSRRIERFQFGVCHTKIVRRLVGHQKAVVTVIYVAARRIHGYIPACIGVGHELVFVLVHLQIIQT